MAYRNEHKVAHFRCNTNACEQTQHNAESLPAVFVEDCAACSFSVGFVSTGTAGGPSLSLPVVEQYWICVHVNDVTLDSGKLNQSLCTPPPCFQPIEYITCCIMGMISGYCLELFK